MIQTLWNIRTSMLYQAISRTIAIVNLHGVVNGSRFLPFRMFELAYRVYSLPL